MSALELPGPGRGGRPGHRPLRRGCATARARSRPAAAERQIAVREASGLERRLVTPTRARRTASLDEVDLDDPGWQRAGGGRGQRGRQEHAGEGADRAVSRPTSGRILVDGPPVPSPAQLTAATAGDLPGLRAPRAAAPGRRSGSPIRPRRGPAGHPPDRATSCGAGGRPAAPTRSSRGWPSGGQTQLGRRRSTGRELSQGGVAADWRLARGLMKQDPADAWCWTSRPPRSIPQSEHDLFAAFAGTGPRDLGAAQRRHHDLDLAPVLHGRR